MYGKIDAHSTWWRDGMTVDLDSTLRKALAQLQSHRERLNRQIIALETALDGVSGATGPVTGAVSRPARKRSMSAAARRAVGQRMKAYWAKRRGQTQKTKGKSTKKR
jgi:hypothetical protein